ncbi:Fc.00g105330.m01.CDS01 [Cosmosporella sp. VM-42]
MKSQLLFLATLAPLSLAQSYCGQYDHMSSNGWYLNNNEWGASSGTGTQCTYLDSVNSGGISWHTDWDWADGTNKVKSYPHCGRDLTTKKLVSNIGSITNSAAWSYQGSNLRCNVAYDLFTAADPNHATTDGDYELMIWLGRYGGVQPIGTSQGTVAVGSASWELFIGYNGAMKVFSFVAPSAKTSFTSDIKPFFNYLTTNKAFPASSQYLITFQFGSEPFTGDSARFIVGHWDGSVN